MLAEELAPINILASDSYFYSGKEDDFNEWWTLRYINVGFN